MKIGDKVLFNRDKHKDHSFGYAHHAARREADGHVGVVKEQTENGVCLTVTVELDAWADHSELSVVRTAAASPSIDRETLGMLVRDEWVKWAREQPNPKPSWLVPWEGLSEPDKEVDRRIGERIVREMRFLSRFTPKQIAGFDEDSGMTLDQAERWMMGGDKPKPTPEAVITAMLGAYAVAAAKAEIRATKKNATTGELMRFRAARNELLLMVASAAAFFDDGQILLWLKNETNYQARLDGSVPLDAPPVGAGLL